MTKLGPIKALGKIIQLAYLPTDFAAAIEYWTETVGVGPFFLLENVRLGDMKYRGHPSDAVFSIAIGYWGDIQIELCRAENDAPSIYRGEYAVTERLHHVCIFVESIAEARRACIEAGAEIIVEGRVGDSGEVIYVDAGGGSGHLIELLQPMAGSEGLFEMMRLAAQDWDGSDPLRIVG